MKNIKLLIALIAITLMAGACKQQPKKNVQAETKEQPAEIQYKTVEDILKNSESLSGKTIHVSGLIDHVCKHGGKRFKMLSSDGNEYMKIELDDSFDMPSPEIAGKTAKVVGTLVPHEMDLDTFKKMVEREKKEHAAEGEDYEHVKELEVILRKIESGEIASYIAYSVQAEKYDLE